MTLLVSRANVADSSVVNCILGLCRDEFSLSLAGRKSRGGLSLTGLSLLVLDKLALARGISRVNFGWPA
jgi:hypothetical protein